MERANEKKVFLKQGGSLSRVGCSIGRGKKAIFSCSRSPPLPRDTISHARLAIRGTVYRGRRPFLYGSHPSFYFHLGPSLRTPPFLRAPTQFFSQSNSLPRDVSTLPLTIVLSSFDRDINKKAFLYARIFIYLYT